MLSAPLGVCGCSLCPGMIPISLELTPLKITSSCGEVTTVPFQEHSWDVRLGSQWKFSLARGLTEPFKKQHEGCVWVCFLFLFLFSHGRKSVAILFSFDL